MLIRPAREIALLAMASFALMTMVFAAAPGSWLETMGEATAASGMAALPPPPEHIVAAVEAPSPTPSPTSSPSHPRLPSRASSKSASG